MGADMPGMGGQDMAAMAAYSAKVNKLAQSGVEAPGVIHTITATGTPDISGATMHAIAVTYRPEGGDPIETTIEQSLLPFQLERTGRGQALHGEVRPRTCRRRQSCRAGKRAMGVFKDGFKAIKGAKELGDYHGGMPSIEGRVQGHHRPLRRPGPGRDPEARHAHQGAWLGFPMQVDKFSMGIELDVFPPEGGDPYKVAVRVPDRRA